MLTPYICCPSWFCPADQLTWSPCPKSIAVMNLSDYTSCRHGVLRLSCNRRGMHAPVGHDKLWQNAYPTYECRCDMWNAVIEIEISNPIIYACFSISKQHFKQGYYMCCSSRMAHHVTCFVYYISALLALAYSNLHMYTQMSVLFILTNGSETGISNVQWTNHILDGGKGYYTLRCYFPFC